MDIFLIRKKLKTYKITEDPFLEIRKCFSPCLKDLSKESVNDKEKVCFSNCMRKYIKMTRDFRLRSGLYINERRSAM